MTVVDDNGWRVGVWERVWGVVPCPHVPPSCEHSSGQKAGVRDRDQTVFDAVLKRVIR